MVRLGEKIWVITSQLREIFCEQVKLLIARNVYALELRPDLLHRRVLTYAIALKEQSPYEDFVGLIKYTEMRITRSCGHESCLRASFSSHERLNCLIYHTISNFNGLIYAMNRPRRRQTSRSHSTSSKQIRRYSSRISTNPWKIVLHL